MNPRFRFLSVCSLFLGLTLPVSAAVVVNDGETYTVNSDGSGNAMRLVDDFTVNTGGTLDFVTTPQNTEAHSITLNGGTLQFTGSEGGHHDKANSTIANTIGVMLTISGTGNFIVNTSNQLWTNYRSGNDAKITISLDAASKIQIKQGTLINGGGASQDWSNNKASVEISEGATWNLRDGNTAYIGALTGNGNVTFGNGDVSRSLVLGVANQGGVFEGDFTANEGTTTGALTIKKIGTGSQTLGDYALNGSITVEGGTLSFADGSTVQPSYSTGTLTLAANAGTTLNLNSGTFKVSKITGTGTIKGGDVTFTLNPTLGVGTTLAVNSITTTGAIDLTGGNLSTKKASTAYSLTNSDETNRSTYTFSGTGSNTTLPQMTGNMGFVLNATANDNANRFFFKNGTTLKYTELKCGTLNTTSLSFTDNAETAKTLYFNGGCLMANNTSFSSDYTFYMMEGGGAYRQGNAVGTVNAKVTGPGSFEVVNDFPTTISNTANDYEGWTKLGVTGYRGANSGTGSIVLGDSEVLPNTTVVQIGGGVITNNLTLDLNGKTETVAGLTGGTTGTAQNGIVTSSVSGGTLTLNDSANYTFSGKITGSATVEKAGSATWTFTGSAASGTLLKVSNGTLNLSSSASVDTLAVAGGTAKISDSATVTTLNTTGGATNITSTKSLTNATLAGGIVAFGANTSVSSTAITVTADSTLQMNSGYYLREMFESTQDKTVDDYYRYDGDLTSAAQQISNMDQWVNKSYALTSAPDDSVWGDRSTDKSVTNVFQMNLKNVTENDITLDFGKSFRNDVQILITDSTGAQVGLMDWTKTDGVAGRAIDTTSATGIVFKAGEEYTLTMRASRYNRTIGTNINPDDVWLGDLNQDLENPVGVGVKATGTDLWYGLNIVVGSGEFGWAGSGIYTTTANDVTFNPTSLSIDSGKTLTLNLTPFATTNIAPTASTGTGTLNLQCANNYTATADIQKSLAGNLTVGENVELHVSGSNVAVGETLTLEAGSSIQIDGDSTQLTVKNLVGAANVTVDLATTPSNTSDLAWINVTGNYSDENQYAILFDGTVEEAWGKEYYVFGNLPADKMAEIPISGPLEFQVDASGRGYFGLNYSAVPEPSAWLLLVLGLIFGAKLIRTNNE